MGDWRLINIQTSKPLLHHMEDHEGFVKVPLTCSVGPVYLSKGPLKLRFTSGILGCHKSTLVTLIYFQSSL